MKTREEIIRIIDTASRWECIPVKGAYTVWCDGDDMTVTMDELTMVDPKLPMVMEDMLDRRGHSLESLPGYWARYTLAYWRGERATVQSCWGDVHVVHALKYFSFPDVYKGEIIIWGGCLSGTAAVGFRKKVTPPPVLYIEYASDNEILVSAAWMDQHYPGWRQRLLALEALGETDDNIVEQVLCPPTGTCEVVVPSDIFGTL